MAPKYRELIFSFKNSKGKARSPAIFSDPLVRSGIVLSPVT